MKRCPNCGKQYLDDANFCPVDAGRLVPDSSEPAAEGEAEATGAPGGGTLLGQRFELGAMIGGGVTGQIREAKDTSTGRDCVVKIVLDRVFPSALVRQRTERQLRQLVRVQAPGVVRILAHGSEGNQVWVAMEKVAGTPLSSLVETSGPLSPDRARAIVLKVGAALAEAAKVGVIHRDVSPKNVLVCDGDEVRLINFSLPAPLKENLQGVPEFLSPEQIEGKPVDQRSNIYSLGALFYFALTGRPPYAGDPDSVLQQHLAGNLEPPSQHGDVPRAFDSIVVRALQRASSKRFMTLRQLLGDLERADAGGGPAAAAAQGKGKPGEVDAAKTMMGGFGTDLATLRDAALAKKGASAEAAPAKAEPAAAPAQSAESAPVPAAVQQPEAQTAPAQAAASFAGPSGGPPAPAPEPAPSAPEPAPAATPAPAAAPAAASPAPAAAAAPAAGGEAEAQSPADDALKQVAAAAQQRAADAAAQASAPMPGPSVPAAKPEAAAGKKGKGKNGGGVPESKGQFRETMWFKKGAMDAVAAEEAAKAVAAGKDDGIVLDKADELPIEDRYGDDGSISKQDKQAFSLRTGHTQMMQAPQAQNRPRGAMKEDELVSEMRSGRGPVLIGISIAVFILLVVIVLLATGGEEEKSGEESPAAAEAAETAGGEE